MRAPTTFAQTGARSALKWAEVVASDIAIERAIEALQHGFQRVDINAFAEEFAMSRHATTAFRRCDRPVAESLPAPFAHRSGQTTAHGYGPVAGRDRERRWHRRL